MKQLINTVTAAAKAFAHLLFVVLVLIQTYAAVAGPETTQKRCIELLRPIATQDLCTYFEAPKHAGP